MEIEEVAELVRRIKGDFPRATVNNETATRWFGYLRGFRGDDVFRIYEEWFKNETQPPSFSDIYARVKGYKSHDSASDPYTTPEKKDPNVVLVNRSGPGEKIFYQKANKQDCVFDFKKKEWKLKIDFCMDYLGAAKVAQILKQELGAKNAREVEKEVIAGRFDVTQYKKTLEGMLIAARLEAQQ